jgi:hypothetical protein
MGRLEKKKTLEFRIRFMLWVVIVGLFVAGVTAFPLLWEMQQIVDFFGWQSAAGTGELSGFAQWIIKVRDALSETYAKFPFLAYATDWLAFAHIVLAILFWGALKDPVKNIWVIEFGMICCVLVLPLALIAGPLREIPFWWRVIDCSFALAVVPLYFGRKWVVELENL